MAENKVSVEITLEEKAALKALASLTKDIQKTEGSFKKMGSQGDESLGSVGQTAKGVSSSFGALVGGVTVANLASEAIIGTARAIKNFVLDSVNASIEAEQSNNRLAQSLRATGSFSKAAVEDFRAFSEAMAETTRHGDDEIINQIALAKSMGATNEQAKQLVLAAIEMSATFGGSLDSRVEQLGKTLQGTAGKLGQLIPGFKDLTEAQLKSGAAFELISSKYGGAAAAELDTFSGTLGQLTKAFGELQETTGGYVTESGYFREVIAGATLMIQDFTKSIIESRQAAKNWEDGYEAAGSTVAQLTSEHENLRLKIIETEESIRNSGINMYIADEGRARLKALNDDLAITAAAMEEARKRESAARGDTLIASGKLPKTASGMSDEDKKLVASRQEAHAQLIAAEAEFQAFQNEQRLVGVTLDDENRAIELQKLTDFEMARVNARFLAEEQKNSIISDAQTRELAQAKTAADKKLAIERASLEASKKIDQQEIAQDKIKNTTQTDNMRATLSTIATLQSSSSKELFAVGKAAAISQATIDGFAAVQKALASAPPPFNFALAALVGAATAANVSKIASQKPPGFAYGGIVPGTSTSGDNVPIRVNSGEMVLNKNQQARLFGIANGQGEEGGVSAAINRLADAILAQPVNLTVDGRALATVIRGEVRSGFKLA